jgi:hypothetical protein
MDRSGFACVVAEMVLRGLDEAGNRGVDYSSRIGVLGLACSLKERKECGRHEELLADIHAVGVGLVLERRVLRIKKIPLHLFCCLRLNLLCGPTNTGVVDKDAEAFLTGFNLFYQPGDFAL